MSLAAQEAASANEPDFWDSTGQGMWFLQVEPTSLMGLWVDEQDTLYIYGEKDGFWLSTPGEAGQSQHATLEEAKASGNAFHAARLAAMPANMLADAGLDPADWTFVYQDGARFIHLWDESLVIEIDIDGANVAERFTAYFSEREVGTYAKASDAAEFLVADAAPRP